MKKLFLFIVLSVAFVACNNNQTENQDAVAEEKVMTVDELQANLENLVDSMVVFKGEVDHVCKHGGTKMVVFNPETDNSIHVDAGESGNFRADQVANHNVIVWGKVEEMRVDDAYIEEMQAELDADIAKGGDGEEMAEEMDKAKQPEHRGEGVPENDNKHKQELEQRIEQIKNLRVKLDELKAAGKDHISYYSVRCEKYEVLDEAVAPAEADTTKSE